MWFGVLSQIFYADFEHARIMQIMGENDQKAYFRVLYSHTNIKKDQIWHSDKLGLCAETYDFYFFGVDLLNSFNSG